MKAKNNFIKAISMGVITKTTKEELLKLETEENQLETSISSLSIINPNFSYEKIKCGIQALVSLSVDSPAQKEAIIIHL